MFVPLVRFRVGKKNLYKLFLFKILVLLIVAHSCDLITPDQGLSLLPQGRDRRPTVNKVKP